MPGVYRAADVEIQVDVKTPMRDGIQLSGDLYKPPGEGQFPVILGRTPYDNQSAIRAATFFAQQGYAYFAQDVRGRFDSAGVFDALRNEARDGYDTLEWLGAQPWCDGSVGMRGGSYEGVVQWAAASSGSQYLKAIVPAVVAPNLYKDGIYRGSALSLSLALMWRCFTGGRTNQSLELYRWSEVFRQLPLIDADRAIGPSVGFYRDWVAHPSYDDFWKEIAFDEMFAKIQVPVLQFSGWYDVFASGVLPAWQGMRQHGGSAAARENQRVIMGPWIHHMTNYTGPGELDFGSKSLQDLLGMELAWFNRWLKGKENGMEEQAPLRIFVMGINEWREEHEWPLERTLFTSHYLHSGGLANSLHGDGALSTDAPGEQAADRFIYDPDYPAPTIGGNNCCWPNIVAWGAYDQRCVEQRQDVLCYTSSPLEHDLEVTGPVVVKLYAASDAPDTDFTAKLVDVSPDGYAVNLCDGIIRARYRNSMEAPELLKPGEVYAYVIRLGDTSNVFLKGHRIRLEISSSNFPHFDRNPNTGHAFGMDAETRKAQQTVLHNSRYPSQLILPVIPR